MNLDDISPTFPSSTFPLLPPYNHSFSSGGDGVSKGDGDEISEIRGDILMVILMSIFVSLFLCFYSTSLIQIQMIGELR